MTYKSQTLSEYNSPDTSYFTYDKYTDEIRDYSYHWWMLANMN